MAIKSGFFNAIYDQASGVYLPRYDASEFARRFSLYLTNGVFYSNSGALQVTASGGLKLLVAIGACNINGYEGVNEQAEEITLESADSLYPRYDGIAVRLDITNKKIDFAIIKGTASATPTKPTVDTLTRSDLVYDLMLAYVYIGAGATSVSNANITDTRGNSNVCGFVTATVTQLDTSTFWLQWQKAFEEYADKQEADFMSWWNGLKDTLATIDATALLVRQDALEAKLDSYTEYDYICNGSTDNIELTNKVQALLARTAYGACTVRVFGTFGATEPVEGAGTATNWYKWLKLGLTTAPSNNRVIVDFSNCSAINVPIKAGAYNTIISGGDIHIKGVTVVANNSTANTAVRIFDNTALPVECENSRFWITAYKESYIARHGYFKSCMASVANVIGNSYCYFTHASGLLRVEGGEYYAYTGSSNAISAVVAQTEGAGASILYAVNCPILARSSYYQTNSVYITVGASSVTDLITTLALTAVGANVRGTLALNRPNAL